MISQETVIDLLWRDKMSAYYLLNIIPGSLILFNSELAEVCITVSIFQMVKTEVPKGKVT